MPSYKFHYFDIRGKGELCRLCFVATGVLFDDVRIARGDWNLERKAETPFGQLPYLEIDGQKFAQSLAIAQYISREHGLYGESSLEALAIDGVTGLTSDYFSLWRKAYWMEDCPEKTRLQTKLKEEDLPKLLGNLDKILTGNPNSGYYVGGKLTLADLAVYDVLENSYRDFPEVYSNFPKVVENRKKIAALAQMQIYLTARKVTEI